MPVVTTRQELHRRIEDLPDDRLDEAARLLDEAAVPPGESLDSNDVVLQRRTHQAQAQSRAAQDAARPTLAWALSHPLHAPGSAQAAAAARDSAAIDAEAEALNADADAA
jgi:hypothetical protein